MLQRGKVLVFLGSAIIVLYGVSAAFYGKVVAEDEAYKELSVFMDALKKINDEYVEAPEMSKVQEGAFRGLLAALDPYSSYLSKEQLQQLEKRRQNGKAGLGVILSKRADVIYVLSVQRDGSGAKAGVRPGDYLVAVDGRSVEDLSILEAESLLLGPSDSKVKLTVFRGGRAKPVDIECVRKAEPAALPSSQMLDGNIGVLDIPSLAHVTADQLRTKLKTLISAGAQKIILDLRDCADGDPAQGADLANMFMKEGLIYYSQNRQREKTEQVHAAAEKFVTDLPTVVLINGSTAGPAEIVAGALKDSKRAALVGEKSFGVGSAQKQIALKSGAMLFLSVAKFYTPSGKVIQDDVTVRNAGIKPDVQAPDDERRQDLAVQAYYDDPQDTTKFRQLQEKIEKEQLEKAVEVLTKGVVTQKKAA